jgi:AraC-like DNA-binding protein
MKPMYEKVLPTANASWRYWLYELDEIPFNWHYHPEYEICLTLNSRGQRYIGDQIDDYDDLDLVFLGPKLPHTWYSKETIKGNSHLTYVAQLPASWIESMASMPELKYLEELLQKSKQGLQFSESTAKLCKKHFETMANANSMHRLILLLDILQLMIEDPKSYTICSDGYVTTDFADTTTEKIDRVIDYIRQNYTTDLRAEDMAELAHMSTNHFHRFFKQRTEQTFTELVNELRIGKACKLLVTTDLPISTISYRCGFNNISNFNRRFLQLKQCTPREFKRSYHFN